MEIEKALYMIPTGMSAGLPDDVIPRGNLLIMAEIHHYIVENVREARRFLKQCIPDLDISLIEFYELNRHTPLESVSSYLEPLRRGMAMGVMSDAGCPAIADPGALPAALAQREGLRVIPLVGPSSILMSLMASGFNGQGFAFHGYLPIEESARILDVKRLENDSSKHQMTQIFIETPYRNERLLRLLCETLRPSTRLCFACDITDPQREFIRTMKADQWLRYINDPQREHIFDKRPAIFLIYAAETESVQQRKKGSRAK